MASVTTGGVHKPSAGTYLWGYGNFWISAESATSVTIHGEGYAYSDASIQNGVNSCGSINGIYSSVGEGVTNGGTHIAHWYQDVVIQKTTSIQNIVCGARIWGATVGGWYGYNNGLTSGDQWSPLASASCSITVASIPTPASPSNCNHTRTNDNQNILSWTNNGANPRTSNLVERSVDGGGYSQIASVDGSSTSYVDAATQLDHSYAYRVRTVFVANGYSLHSGYSNATTPTYNTPAAPSSAAAENSDNALILRWVDNARYESGFSIERSANGSSDWLVVASLAAGVTSWTDNNPLPGYNYYRVRAYRDSLYSAYSTTGSVIMYVEPVAPTEISNTRNSDTSNTIAWTNEASVIAPYTSVILQRSVDGGGYSALATLAGATTSYADTSNSPNHSYSYRVAAQNVAGTSSYAASGTTYNTPATPTSLAASRLTETKVQVAFTNTGETETAIGVQRSTNGTSWATLASVSGTALTSIEDTPGGGTFYYRVRGERGSLFSAWSAASNAVVTIVAPAAPTLTSPVSGVSVSLNSESMRFTWKHNAIDGSAQTTAQLRFSIDGGTTWTTATVSGSAQYYDHVNNWPLNTNVLWGVRTKGAHADYSAWSASSSFNAYQVPTVAVTTPATDNTIITDVPLLIAWAYSDPSGTQTQATISIKQEDKEVFKKTLTGTVNSYSVSAAELLPANNSQYEIALQTASTTTFTASTVRLFSVDYIEPATPSADINVDSVMGSVAVNVIVGEGTTGTPVTKELGLFRCTEDGRTLSLGQALDNYASVVDVYPPLDQELTYVVVAYTVNGLTSRSEFTVYINSHGAVFINYGEGYREVAKVVLERKIDWLVEHDKQIYATAGIDRDPLVFYGHAESTKGSFSGVIFRDQAMYPTFGDPSTVSDFIELAENVGYVILRRPKGGVIPADITVSLSDGVDKETAGVSVFWEKVRGNELAI